MNFDLTIDDDCSTIEFYSIIRDEDSKKFRDFDISDYDKALDYLSELRRLYCNHHFSMYLIGFHLDLVGFDCIC